MAQLRSPMQLLLGSSDSPTPDISGGVGDLTNLTGPSPTSWTDNPDASTGTSTQPNKATLVQPPGSTPQSSPSGTDLSSPVPNGGFTPSKNAPPGQYTPSIAQATWASQGGAGPEPAAGSSGSNVEQFENMLDDTSKYKDAQSAVDAFNALGLNGDSSGLSSNYGSSPAVYDNGNTIGLPDRVLLRQPDGSWKTEMRGPDSGSSSGSSGSSSGLPVNTGGSSPSDLYSALFNGPGVGGQVLPNVVDPNMANSQNFLSNILAELQRSLSPQAGGK